ncbi:MAG: type II toxin-antitoxin system HicB family antitoxin [Alphaproteobacteria bacterium]|nr:type II toxin-antitoxin system HicB family antitoxin [Alphaproteobacteria bacterium]MDA8029656.1 type II toxin-antitoxin system HicB family antitoxin [Alphaproteobacteria bacterium]
MKWIIYLQIYKYPHLAHNAMMVAPQTEYLVIIGKDNEAFYAFIPKIPACFTHGKTYKQVLKRAKDVARTMLEESHRNVIGVNDPNRSYGIDHMRKIGIKKIGTEMITV